MSTELPLSQNPSDLSETPPRVCLVLLFFFCAVGNFWSYLLKTNSHEQMGTSMNRRKNCSSSAVVQRLLIKSVLEWLCSFLQSLLHSKVQPVITAQGQGNVCVCVCVPDQSDSSVLQHSVEPSPQTQSDIKYMCVSPCLCVIVQIEEEKTFDLCFPTGL